MKQILKKAIVTNQIANTCLDVKLIEEKSTTTKLFIETNYYNLEGVFISSRKEEFSLNEYRKAISRYTELLVIFC